MEAVIKLVLDSIDFVSSFYLRLTFKNCLLCLGVGDKEVAESYTVRRKASGGKRSKEASSSSTVARLPLHLISIPGYEIHSVIYDC